MMRRRIGIDFGALAEPAPAGPFARIFRSPLQACRPSFLLLPHEQPAQYQ